MQLLFRALAGALAAGVLAGASAPGVMAADAGSPGESRPVQRVIDWKPCALDDTAECGTLSLPVDWAHPSGEKFDLAVARRKATDPDRRVGVLLVNPGGPGDSGWTSPYGAPRPTSVRTFRRGSTSSGSTRGVSQAANRWCARRSCWPSGPPRTPRSAGVRSTGRLQP
ncbi:hypothetical protein NKH18_35325 [Streptomyces sp. M10(2022)]